MSPHGALAFVRDRFAQRSDSEHGQAIVRLVIVSIVAVYFVTDIFRDAVSSADRAHYASVLTCTSLVVSLVILSHIVVKPAVCVWRRLAGMTHDVAGISLSMYFGEGAGAIVGVIYLWITVGNGFRYGVSYLYGCAALCVTGFALVHANSPYWQSNGLLSLYVLITLVIVPPYVGSLLRSLNKATEQLELRARIDSLTGLYRRSEIESKVEQLFEDDSSGHVLLFCDLDRFKEVNDIAGHAAGDKLLVDVASIIRQYIRASDIPCRVGGDEFCVLLYRCSIEKGREIAEELRSRVSAYRLAWGTNYFSVGISIGLASTDAVNDADSLFRLADAACYAAKNAGRNRVHVVDQRQELISTAAIRLKKLGGNLGN